MEDKAAENCLQVQEEFRNRKEDGSGRTGRLSRALAGVPVPTRTRYIDFLNSALTP